MTLKLEKVNQLPIAENIAKILRGQIVGGSLPAGTPLREAHIATELGVSRAPVREALHRLELDGLVVKLPYKGTSVNGIGPETVDEITGLRAVLEPYAVELALPALRGRSRRRFRAAVKRLSDLSAKGDLPGCVEAHLEIHGLFYELSGSRLLLGLWRTMEAQLGMYFAVNHHLFPSLADVAGKHVELLKCIEEGDLDTIRAHLSVHIGGPARAYSETQRDRQKPQGRKAGSTAGSRSSAAGTADEAGGGLK